MQLLPSDYLATKKLHTLDRAPEEVLQKIVEANDFTRLVNRVLLMSIDIIKGPRLFYIRLLQR